MNYEIKDFIGVFDTNCNTDALIQFFETQEKRGCTFNRGMYRSNVSNAIGKSNFIKDNITSITDYILDPNFPFLTEYNRITVECLDLYASKYESCVEYELQQIYLNIQKTLPGEGYHNWHHEYGSRTTSHRVLVTSMYLNTVEEGGETEFLYQHRRIKPVKGRFLIWPAGFTHTHRGLPPLSGEKYIATSWLEGKL